MADLDSKLDKLLEGMGDSYYPGHEYPESYEPQNIELRKEALAQIKQAFIDAGWVRIPQAELVERRGKGGPLEYRIDGERVMIGQEWYDKFIGALGGKIVEHTSYHDDGSQSVVRYIEEDDALDAAKKASGIE